MKLKQYLKELSELHAPTGEEREVAEYMEKHFKRAGFKVRRDVLGNVHAVKGRGKKVMVAAHMDEVSLAVSSITKEGFLRFVKVGGLYNATIGTRRVTVHAKKMIPGIIGMKAPHLMKKEDLQKVQEHEEMYIDVGAKDEAEAGKWGIRPGTNVSFDAEFHEFPNHRIVGKALDDRVGCAILLVLADEISSPNCELHLVGTVREETGLFGAGTAAYGVKPDFAIAVDVTLACGSPDITAEKVPAEFGKGPVINVVEASGRGLIMPHDLVEWIEKMAAKNKINHQYEVAEMGASDASRMQYMETGVLTASIGVPSRYLHSISEMIDLRDAENAANLLKTRVKEFKNYK